MRHVAFTFSFSPTDLEELDVDDLIWWHEQAVELNQELNSSE